MTDTSFADSYIETDAELETLIGSDPRVAAVALKAAVAASQAWYCQEASRHIDALPLRGSRYEEKFIENGVQVDTNGDAQTQTLEFPRYLDGVVCDWDHATDLPVVPAEIKRACMEEAIAIYQAGTSGGLKDLQEQGVSAMSIGGKLSYSFVPGSASSPLLSAAARRIMRKYTGAAVR